MSVCGSCSHQNADHLAYCSRCGRRLRPATDPTDATAAGAKTHLSLSSLAGSGTAAPAGLGGAVGRTALAAAAPTSVDVADVTGRPSPSSPGVAPDGGAANGVAEVRDTTPIARGWDAVRYVFVYLRGKLDAEERRRTLAQEREGAERLVESALYDVGTAVLREGIQGEALTGLLEELGRAQARREAAAGDLAAAEKAQAADDLRLGIEQSACESEWKACDAGAREMEEMLKLLDRERQQAMSELARLDRADAEERAVIEERLERMKQQKVALRDRAAALRASTVAARAKLDKAAAHRRDTSAAMTASITGHARERASAERQIRELTTQIGAVAAERRPRLPALLPHYDRIDRLRETIAQRQQELAQVQRMLGRFDRKKLAAGLGLLGGVLGAAGVAIWALLR